MKKFVAMALLCGFLSSVVIGCENKPADNKAAPPAAKPADGGAKPADAKPADKPK